MFNVQQLSKRTREKSILEIIHHSFFALGHVSLNPINRTVRPGGGSSLREHLRRGSTQPALAVDDVRHGAILCQMHIEPVLVKVLGNHHPRLDDTRLLGKIPFAEDLS
jgi:hypothetical protein